jgi:hypothetical protein
MSEEKLRKIISLYREKVNTKEDGVFTDNPTLPLKIGIFVAFALFFLISNLLDFPFISFIYATVLLTVGPLVLILFLVKPDKDKSKHYEQLMKVLKEERIDIEDEITFREFFYRYYDFKIKIKYDDSFTLLTEEAIDYYKKRTAESLTMMEIWNSVQDFPYIYDLIYRFSGEDRFGGEDECF